jgi:hypothetical protein
MSLGKTMNMKSDAALRHLEKSPKTHLITSSRKTRARAVENLSISICSAFVFVLFSFLRVLCVVGVGVVFGRG